jgi:hypothetical protein
MNALEDKSLSDLRITVVHTDKSAHIATSSGFFSIFQPDFQDFRP